ncbi:MAG: hypothetical protein QOH47_1481 [Sphingomonadales bacterium]|jgi:hypothetical protein|nr:hypothetical protein [Sphingomonadales bacterium]
MLTAPFFALTLLASSAPIAAPAQTNDAQPTIVVTGPRMQEFRDRLAACLARHCPVNEDVDATLALAEALFLNGDYAAARTTVRASLGRNRDQARNYPEPVSDLYRAGSRITRHIGLDREARIDSFGILTALQAGIPREDHRHFTARLEIAELQMVSSHLQSSSFGGARRELQELARVARAAGREDVATIAELRERWYELIAYPGSTSAMTALTEWAGRTDPAERMRANGARIILARIYRYQGDEARANALLAQVAQSGASARRRLIHSPHYTLGQQEMRLEGDQDLIEAIRYGNTLNRVTENYDNKWIDVGFWVMPDGRVSGLEIVRHGATADWSEPLLEAIRGRTYSAGPEATYRLERYTFTAPMQQGTGSRIGHRAPNARAEYLDLTVEGQMPPPPAAPTGGMTR